MDRYVDEGIWLPHLAELDARRIRIEVVDGRMRVDAPVGALSAGLRAALLAHRAKLLVLLETRAADTTPAALLASGAGDVPASPPLPISASPALPVGPEGTLRIPLDDLVYGDFLARNKLRIVGGTAYPDGRTYRPTIYLADDPS
jgi:hypothetical protein